MGIIEAIVRPLPLQWKGAVYSESIHEQNYLDAPCYASFSILVIKYNLWFFSISLEIVGLVLISIIILNLKKDWDNRGLPE